MAIENKKVVHSKVDFTKKILDWDGFGFNYVETAQTPDYTVDPQDYGGFRLLSEEKQNEIIEAVFGENGLKPSTVKMFLDPFHQDGEHINEEGYDKINQANYDHETYTEQMRKFVKNGLKLSRANGRDFSILTALYGPPSFMTLQKVMRGRDLDPKHYIECAKYMVSWVKYLKENDYPIKYVSIHNEGEDYHRWPYDGSDANLGTGHDYNLYWTPDAVADFMKVLRDVLDSNGLEDVYPTPGETSNWTRFYNWGYANAIADNEEAVNAIGLITSHGFSGGSTGDVWHGDHRSCGIDAIRSKRPELHAWVTSTSWAKMDACFVQQIHGNIYSAKCNSIIPWAGIQDPTKWVGGDPNPGNAIQVNLDGTYELRNGYYYYKQVCPVGQAGMSVVKTHSTATSSSVIAFESGETDNPNAFVVTNSDERDMVFDIKIIGNKSDTYKAYMTSPTNKCEDMGEFKVKDGIITVELEADSVITFVETENDF